MVWLVGRIQHDYGVFEAVPGMVYAMLFATSQFTHQLPVGSLVTFNVLLWGLRKPKIGDRARPPNRAPETFFLSDPKPRTSHAHARDFRAADHNMDGKLSRDELRGSSNMCCFI